VAKKARDQPPAVSPGIDRHLSPSRPGCKTISVNEEITSGRHFGQVLAVFWSVTGQFLASAMERSS